MLFMFIVCVYVLLALLVVVCFDSTTLLAGLGVCFSASLWILWFGGVVVCTLVIWFAVLLR